MSSFEFGNARQFFLPVTDSCGLICKRIFLISEVSHWPVRQLKYRDMFLASFFPPLINSFGLIAAITYWSLEK